MRHAANKWLPECFRSGSRANSTNGWGEVFLAGEVRKAFRSQVPVSLFTSAACPTKAYIFWLEAIAQVLSELYFQPFVQGHLVCVVDNVATEHALQKGYSKDAKFTNLLGAFCGWVASKSPSLSFHRVTSAANVSDGISRSKRELATSTKSSSSTGLQVPAGLEEQELHVQSMFADLEKCILSSTRTRVGTARVSG